MKILVNELNYAVITDEQSESLIGASFWDAKKMISTADHLRTIEEYEVADNFELESLNGPGSIAEFREDYTPIGVFRK